MENLKALSNEVLLEKTHALVSEERRIMTSVLWYLHEIQRRRLYAEKGYGSLFEYAVKCLGYSEGAASCRISAMRLLADVPQIEPALEKGEVTLSTLCAVQNFFQRKEMPTSREEKAELVFALQGKSRRECEKELVALDPKAVMPKERERAVSPSQTEICFIADDALMDKLGKIRELDGHVSSNASYSELFHRIADLVLRKLEKSKSTESKAIVTPPAESSKPIPVNRRYISAALRREVWMRDQSRCTYKAPEGRRCESRFALEIDHKTPLALGGQTLLQNLQLLCRSHNQHKAIIQLGSRMMQSYIRI